MAISNQFELAARRVAPQAWWLKYLGAMGPGLIVAFADTEAGSVTTAATSGAQFGMKLVLFQLLLIVPLFVVQEMTVRLGTISGRGHAALIFGLPAAPLVVVAATALIGIAFSGRYRRAEYFALGLCLLEILFVPAAFAAHPSWANVVGNGVLGSQPLGDRSYLLLVAGNIGAVIMPWMIFYQQSATVDKRLTVEDIPMARVDTAIGAVATQLIMIAIIVTTAATLFVHHQTISDAAHAALALVPLTGAQWAGAAFGAGLLGAAMLGALVVTLASAWAFGEAFRWPCSLNLNCVEAKRSYGFYAALVVLAAGIVLIPGLPLIQVTIEVMAFNAFVLPIVLGFLLVMANDKNILGDRVNSWLGNAIAFSVSIVCVVLGLWLAFLTFTGQAGT